MTNLTAPWSPADAVELYNVRGWGQGYFDVNQAGHVVCYPRRDGRHGIDLKALIEDAQAQGLKLPLLIRFSDILHDRLERMQAAFRNAIAEFGYEGAYQGVYPIKVNQQRQVVEEIVRFGAEHNMGLEVGSKPELHAVLATQESPEALVVCNGYKDEAYIRLALRAQRLGKRVILVVEKVGEVSTILRLADEERIAPLIGVRIKLVATGSGRWEDSGGDNSKFGLTAWELMRAVEVMREAGRLDCFRLIHSHLGSQINNIRRIKEAMREFARYYVELRRLGCPVDYVDTGGGLGVDYDGTRSTFGFSINYTEQEYANDVVAVLEETCRHAGLPQPTIITESGRALAAHHAMLAVNVLETASLDGGQWSAAPADEEPHEVLDKLAQVYDGLNQRTMYEYWHDALHFRSEANSLFDLGYLSLGQKARADQVFWRIARRMEHLLRRERRRPEEFEALETLLADKYFCNFSVFQSLPDAWAMKQEFPVMPLHRLDERPTRQGVLQDITCDSDGRVEQYISRTDKAESLPLHVLQPSRPYYLGVFLTGAYQEILGDMHNLFGDTNAVHVALNEDGTWHYEQVIRGEDVSQVLAYVQFRKEILVDRMERQIAQAVREGRMTRLEGKALLDLYLAGLEGYSYLESAPKTGTIRRVVPGTGDTGTEAGSPADEPTPARDPVRAR